MPFKTLEDYVGETPLVRLKRINAGNGNVILAKLEGNNPAGSVKDRPALSMILRAEAAGRIRPGDTLIEATSGNTGIALAMAAAIRGYRMILVMPENQSVERRQTMRAFGAELILTPKAGGMEVARDMATRMRDEGQGVILDQFGNPDNPVAHFEGTGPELWRQTEGRITHFVSSMGTTGTIMGTSRYLKQQNAAIEIIGCEPAEGAQIPGIRKWPEAYLPTIYDPSRVDRIEPVTQADAEEMTRRLAREEGLLVGGSCGMAVVAALRVASTASPDDVIVVLLPDSGRGYLSKVFNDEWLASYGFLPPRSDKTVGDVLRAKSDDLPSFVHTHPTESVADAIAILREYGVSQMPVVRAEPPVMAAEIVGSVVERDLLDALFTGKAKLADTVDAHMSAPLPIVGAGESVKAAIDALQGSDGVVVIEDGRPEGVLTRQDLLGYLAD